MAIHQKDNLSEIIGETINSKRTDAFLNIYAFQVEAIKASTPITNPISRNTLAEYLKLYPQEAFRTEGFIKSRRIPDKLLDWIIENSPRQSNFIFQSLFSNQTSTTTQMNPYSVQSYAPKIPSFMTGRELSIALVDYFSYTHNMTPDHLSNHLDTIKRDWRKITESDFLFAWLEKDNAKEKRIAFWKWVSSKYPVQFPSLNSRFISHDSLLEFFDSPYFSPADKELLSQKFRKVWNQQQARKDRTDKRQCNFILSEATILKLEKLAAKHGLNKTQIIEIIIDSEAKHETYIKERLERELRLISPL